MDFSATASKIKVIILDVDGVLTDGRIGYDGERIIKYFDVRDGHAIKMALRAGLRVGILSGRADPATLKRAEDLGLTFAFTGQKVKLDALRQILAEQQVTPAECLYMGDDVVDIPVMRTVGLPVCVADADPALIPFADWRTEAPGGHGAVREVIFRVMREQRTLEHAMERYLGELPPIG